MAAIELDVWRAANELIRQHGKDAEFIAYQKSDAMLDRGDVAGSSTWLRIAHAIRDLTKTAGDGDKLH